LRISNVLAVRRSSPATQPASYVLETRPLQISRDIRWLLSDT